MKDLQKLVRDFSKKASIENPPHIAALDTVSEIGEAIAEMIKSSEYGKKEFKKTKQLESELGDVLYSLITLANSLDVDLEKSLNIVLKKYSKRIKGTGKAGSGV